jgi:putative ABC transport system ATP-binding protein
MDDVLLISDVSKTYWRGGRPLEVLRDVSLRIGPGMVVAVVGERHEGKTTLLKVAAGIEAPDLGQVRFDGGDLCRLSARKRERLWGQEIAWTSRARPGLDWKMQDYVGLSLRTGRSLGRRVAQARAITALERVGAAECSTRHWSELSDWERMLIGLACGIVSRPRLLVIDDLFDGLGASRMQAAGELLASLARDCNCGVLMSAAGMEAALMADTVWLFDRGGLRLMSDQTSGGGEIVEFPTRRESHGAGS